MTLVLEFANKFLTHARTRAALAALESIEKSRTAPAPYVRRRLVSLEFEMDPCLKAFAKLPASSLDISTRARRCLAEGGFTTMGDIMFASDSALLSIPGMGRGTVGEVRAAGKKAQAEFEGIPQDIIETAESLIANYAFDHALLEGAIRAALLAERRASTRGAAT